MRCESVAKVRIARISGAEMLRRAISEAVYAECMASFAKVNRLTNC